jgi:FkbM family methyltransferase
MNFHSVGHWFGIGTAQKMKTLKVSPMQVLLSIGRKFPKPIRGVLLRSFLTFQRKVSKIKESRNLSDYPQILKPSKRSLGKNVRFDTYTVVETYKLKIKSVCHVGAHKGQEIPDYLRLRIDAAVLIEPVPENYIVLQDAVSGIANFQALNIAVGNHEGLIKMNLASNDFQSSSVLQPYLHLYEAPKVVFDKVIEIEISTLDKILPNSQSWDLIVIDVQGYELKVLEGATRTLKNCNYIFIEVNRDETYKGCAQIKEIDHFLSSHGFRRVVTKWWCSWGDALYVRTNLLPLDLSTE